MRIFKAFFALGALLVGGAWKCATGPDSYINLADQPVPFVGHVFATEILPRGECLKAPGFEEAFACRDGRNDRRLSQYQAEMDSERRAADRIYSLARQGVEWDPRSGFYKKKYDCFRLESPLWRRACLLGVEHGECDASVRRDELYQARTYQWYKRGQASAGPTRGYDDSRNAPPTYSGTTCPGWAASY